ncbi:MAG TPA: hypothetical protein VIL37_14285 [Natronosporangium sp.]
MASRGYTVVHEALRTQAQRWDDLSSEMAAVARNVAGLGLGESAFWIGLPYPDLRAELYAMAYQQFQQYMLELFEGAAREFKELGVALKQAASGYAKVDRIDPNRIFGPPQ